MSDSMNCRCAKLAAASLQRDNAAFRARVEFDLLAAAATAKLRLAKEGLVFASSDDGFVANAALEGIEKLDRSSLERGAAVLFVYLNNAQKMPLPSGFFSVRVMASAPVPAAAGDKPDAPAPARTFKAQFFDLSGNFVCELPATVEDSASEKKVKLSAGLDPPHLDVGFDHVKITIGIEITQ